MACENGHTLYTVSSEPNGADSTQTRTFAGQKQERTISYWKITLECDCGRKKKTEYKTDYGFWYDVE